jgi:hypothetical protein
VATRAIRYLPAQFYARQRVFSDRYQEWLQSYSIFFEGEGLQSPEAGTRDRRQE